MSPEKQRIAIALNHGFFAVINAEDKELVAPFKWRMKNNGTTKYAISDTGGKRVWMHKIVLGIPDRIDHRDNDGLNNTRENLRPISNTNNIRRKRPNAKGTSRFKGVSWYHRTGKWQTSIKVNGRGLALGHYADEKSAALAYDAAARMHFGEFAYLNFPNE